MGLKLNIFTLVALGLFVYVSSQTEPACVCTGADKCKDADAAACECEASEECSVIVAVASGGRETFLGCSGLGCKCTIDTPETKPTCTGAEEVTNGDAELEYTVTSASKTAVCDFELFQTDVSNVGCTTTDEDDVVKMGDLFTCTGIAIATSGGTGCVFIAGTSVACETDESCTVASVHNVGVKCVGVGCSITDGNGLETVASIAKEAVVYISEDIKCTNPDDKEGDCACDTDTESCTSEVVGAVVTGGTDAQSECIVNDSDKPTCTCNASGCGDDPPSDKTCTCTSLGDGDAEDCNDEPAACACHTGGNCAIGVVVAGNPTGLGCSGEDCNCTFADEKATCEGGTTITSGVEVTELTVTNNGGTASCSIVISEVNVVDAPSCIGEATDTIANEHFICSGVVFNTLAPTGCKMLPNDIGECVDTATCTITSSDASNAKCVGVLCSGSHSAGIVTMSSVGGEAMVQSSTEVTCTNPTGEGDCRCINDTDSGALSCKSTTNGGSVTGGGGKTCANDDCTGCSAGSSPTCTCDTTSCEDCSCDGSPTDSPTDSPTEMTTGDEDATTTRGLPSSALMVSHVYEGWVFAALVAVAVAGVE